MALRTVRPPQKRLCHIDICSVRGFRARQTSVIPVVRRPPALLFTVFHIIPWAFRRGTLRAALFWCSGLRKSTTTGASTPISCRGILEAIVGMILSPSASSVNMPSAILTASGILATSACDDKLALNNQHEHNHKAEAEASHDSRH